MVANMIVLGLLQIATIYSETFQQFLAVRALFVSSSHVPTSYLASQLGRNTNTMSRVCSWAVCTAMQSAWPSSIARKLCLALCKLTTSSTDCGFFNSENARGLMSGILQQGYSLGYVLAGCANLGAGGETNSWKSVFWAGGKPPDISLTSISTNRDIQPVFPLASVSFVSSSPSRSNSSKPEHPARRAPQQASSGRKPVPCFALSGRCAFTALSS